MNPAAVPRVGLIGVSGDAKSYLDLLLERHDRGDVQLVAATVIDPAEEPAAVAELQARDVRVYDNYTAMLAPSRHGTLDLCCIPAGIPWHAGTTITALRAGANVLLDKHLAGSVVDLTAIKAAERATNRFVAVGFHDFYVAENLRLKRELLAGVIGPLRSVRFLGLWARPPAYFTRNLRSGPLAAEGAAVSDSPANQAFAHFLNLALFFASPELDACATVDAVEAELRRAHAIESFDTAAIRARTPHGVSLWFGMSHACRHDHEPELRIEGARGTVEWHHEEKFVVRPAPGTVWGVNLPDSTSSRRQMFTAVLQRLRDPATRICTVGMAARHAALLDAVHRVAPVVPFAPDEIEWSGPGPDGLFLPMARDIETTLSRAFADQRLPRERALAPPHAVAPQLATAS